jgi:hypothetical protein
VKSTDLLELELRRLPHVSFVGYLERPDALVVQIVAQHAPDTDALRHQAERTCRAHLDGPFVVEMSGPTRPTRIRLLDVQTPTPDAVEVHLAFAGARGIGRAVGCDPTAAASATFGALQELGATVPFEVEAAAMFEHVVGEGVMLVLRSDEVGQRYGVASGPNVVHAAARATLHALNRYLSTQPLVAAFS